MDQHADASDEQQPDAGKRIEQESNIGAKFRGLARLRRIGQVAGVGAQPSVNGLLKRLVEMFWRGRPSRILPHRSAGHEEYQHNRSNANGADRGFLQLAAEEKHDGRAEGGQQRDQPDVV